MFKKIAIAATLAVLATSAVAVERGHVYAGADFGTTKTDDLSGRSSSYGAYAGYQLNETFAVEAGYRRLAHSTEAGFVDVRGKQRALSMVATVPMTEELSMSYRLGFNKIKSQVTSGATMVQEDRGTFLYGIGMNYNFTKEIVGRVEFQKPSNNLNNVSVGVSVKF